MFNYEDIIDLDNVTLKDCVDMYKRKGEASIINDGRLVGFVKE